MTFEPLWQRAYEAGFQPNLTALLRCISEEGEGAAQERYGWDYETLQDYERHIITRLKLIDPILATEAENLLAPRSCVFCDQSPAPLMVTTFTPEQKAENRAWSESFKDGFHTGHCPNLEMPAFACQACFDARPECHIPICEPMNTPAKPQEPPVLHYWGWTPDGPGIRCGATSDSCTGSAQSTTCPVCLDALAEQLVGISDENSQDPPR